MKDKKLLTIGSLVAFVALIVVVLLFTVFDVFKSGDEKAVEDLFEAQMSAVKGDNEKLEDLDLGDMYGSSLEMFMSNIGFSEAQQTAADKALKDFEYDVKEVNILSEEDKYPMTIEVIYTLDTYPIVNSLSTQYLEKPEDHLSDEELNLFENGSEDEKSEMVTKLVLKYNEDLAKGDIKAVTEKHSIAYEVLEDGTINFAPGNDFNYLIRSVLGMASDLAIE